MSGLVSFAEILLVVVEILSDLAGNLKAKPIDTKTLILKLIIMITYFSEKTNKLEISLEIF